MIDLRTGVMDIDGVVVTPASTLRDFQRYADKVNISHGNNNTGFVNFKNSICSNGIYAKVSIDVNETKQIRIEPLNTGKPEMETIEASKQWLKGMAVGDYRVDKDSICGTYVWGRMLAQGSQNDCDEETTAGSITIDYENPGRA